MARVMRQGKRVKKVAASGKGQGAERGVVARRSGSGVVWGVVLSVVMAVAVLPVVMGRAANDLEAPAAFLAPMALWWGVLFLSLWWSRRSVYSGDRGFVVLTVLLLGLGMVMQLRLGTWAESWTAVRAYAPLLVGLGGFLFCLRFVSAGALRAVLPRVRWLVWLGAMGTFGVLLVFGRSYRGGLFLPGQVNPTELVKLFLVLFAASWLPTRAEGLSRTFCGVPVPPLGDAVALVVVWGLPMVGAVLVRDLGLALILSLTLVLMLTALTRRMGWLVLGLFLAVGSAWAVQLLSSHAAVRFEVWREPFASPLGSGWQMGQSLCAQYAGGLWGTGMGEGLPHLVPIVSSDFIYAAIAEEWGLVGCGLLLVLFWCWLMRMLRRSATTDDPQLRLLGAGIASVLGVQILLNIGGVTKALPMTGITLPLFSQGGFSLLTVLLLCGLVAALTKEHKV